jgi:cyclophilin family peptidyl-prolyl cis-trans isomerase
MSPATTPVWPGAWKHDRMPTDCPASDGSSPKQQRFDGPPPMCIDPTRRHTAEMVTTKGTMTIALDAAAAPKTVNNFVVLARYHYYDGVGFHRIIPGFVVQGGDPEGTGRGGPGYRFEDELPKPGRYEIGSLAMANAGPNTNGSQFFIISGPDGARLPPQYSLFGKVVNGLDVVAALDAVGSAGAGTPKEKVAIESVTITESE